MQKLLRSLVVCLLVALGLTGCGGGALEGGYTPPGVPIRISINSQGEINLGAASSWATPYGTFDLGYGGSVYSLRENIPFDF